MVNRHEKVAYGKGFRQMSRISLLSNPLLLGFDEIERLIDRANKTGDGYPPYNVERIPASNGSGDLLRITLAVAGFAREDLEITLEDSQLTVRGRQKDEQERKYLYRGIAARRSGVAALRRCAERARAVSTSPVVRRLQSDCAAAPPCSSIAAEGVPAPRSPLPSRRPRSAPTSRTAH